MALGLGIVVYWATQSGPAAAIVSAFKSRVIADGGTVESPSCAKSDIAYLTSNPSAPDLLLNDYGGAAAAYSLRLLDKSYTGDAIVVRRASDNTTQNIGFINNELDTASLESFCSGTDGFVTTWYDQSGNGFNVTQTSDAYQPKIVSAGSAITEGGKPIIDFDGSDDYLLNAGSISYNGGVSWYSVQKLDVVSDNKRIWSDDIIGVQGYNQFFSASPHKINDNGTGIQSVTFNSLTANTRQLNSFNFDDSNGAYNYAIDGSNTSATQSGWTGPIGTSGTSNVGIMSAGNGGQYGNGRLQELIIYPNDQSTNRTGIESNINTHYNIYP